MNLSMDWAISRCLRILQRPRWVFHASDWRTKCRFRDIFRKLIGHFVIVDCLWLVDLGNILGIWIGHVCRNLVIGWKIVYTIGNQCFPQFFVSIISIFPEGFIFTFETPIVTKVRMQTWKQVGWNHFEKSIRFINEVHSWSMLHWNLNTRK